MNHGPQREGSIVERFVTLRTQFYPEDLGSKRSFSLLCWQNSEIKWGYWWRTSSRHPNRRLRGKGQTQRSAEEQREPPRSERDWQHSRGGVSGEKQASETKVFSIRVNVYSRRTDMYFEFLGGWIWIFIGIGTFLTDYSLANWNLRKIAHKGIQDEVPPSQVDFSPRFPAHPSREPGLEMVSFPLTTLLGGECVWLLDHPEQKW